jgi:hypothetical protein
VRRFAPIQGHNEKAIGAYSEDSRHSIVVLSHQLRLARIGLSTPLARLTVGAKGEQREVFRAAQREERFAQQPNRRQKASALLAGAARTPWPAGRSGTRHGAPERNPASFRDLLWWRNPAT